jgi:hypothetical protein
MANTVAVRPVVARTAPRRSIDPRRENVEGISVGVSASATSATGMLT